ncbi:MAG: ArnT family glycosyltransferase [Chloroflexota bacterium]
MNWAATLSLHRARAGAWLLLAILVAGAALRVAHLGSHLFHVDEALFAGYGLLIASGQDLLLQSEPVDKPPLFFYLLGLSLRVFGNSETAAALPSLFASVGALWLVYALCRDLYGEGEGLVAAALLAASPFAVAYSYTAFIDPTMVGLALLAALLAGRGRFFRAGLAAGLLPALKAQGVLFWPLLALLAALGLWRRGTGRRRWLGAGTMAALGAALPLLALWAWSNARPQQPPFLELAGAHNPLLPAAPATYLARLDAWWQTSLRFASGSEPLNAVLLVGLPLLLSWGLVRLWRGGAGRRAAATEWALALYGLFFVAWHTYFDLPAWDRYLVGLVPVALVLLARVLLQAWRALSVAFTPRARPVAAYSLGLGLGLALGLGVLLAAPVQAGLRSTYFLGWSGSGGPTTYQGLPAALAYFKAVAPPGAKLYDYRSLSWHYKFYLFDQPYRIIWFDDKYVQSFHEDVLFDPQRGNKFLVLPDWEDDPEVHDRLAGGDAVALTPLYRTYRDDGSHSFTVYKVEAGR